MTLGPERTVDIPPVSGARIPTSRRRRGVGLPLIVAAVFTFLYLPIVLLILFSLNESASTTFPIRGFTLSWYQAAFENQELLQALRNSVTVALSSTLIALVIGTAAALGLHRVDFPGKGLFRRLVLLPLALPGIVTGVAMLNFFGLVGMSLSLRTVILGHATALLAVVITQVFARLQRLSSSYQAASADLGASGWQTFLFVTLPNLRSALIGSALLVFTLSFDEIPVTFFLTGRENTLPMYIYSSMRRGITPDLNAIGTLVVLTSLLVIALSVWLLRDDTA